MTNGQFDHFILENLIVGAADFLASLIVVADNLNSERVGNATAFLFDTIAGQTATLTRDTANSTRIITDSLDSGLTQVNSGIRSLEVQQNSDFGQVIAGIGEVLGVLDSGMQTTIENNILLDNTIFESIVGQVDEVISAQSEANGRVIEGITSTFGDVVTGLIEGLIASESRENPELARIAAAILHNKDINTGVLTQQLSDGADGFGGTTLQSIIERLAPIFELTGDQLRDSLGRSTVGTFDPTCYDENTLFNLENTNSATGVGKKVMDFTIDFGAHVFLWLAMFQSQSNAKMNLFRLCNPDQVLPVGESLASLYRGLITPNEARNNIMSVGFTLESADLFIESSQTIPDIAFLYTMFTRDLIDESGLEFGLKALGYPEGFIEPLKTLVFFIPPVQDLITMAVREVFSPEIAEAQGQFEDFPEDFEKFAKQQGVSAEWARNYWAAHWALPSVQMGFQMMHRGVISQDRLKELLRALDVMPFWRQPLIDISFKPFTRVDIRRMHRVDVLTDADVFAAYKDLGYDTNKAGLLRDFVLELNKEDEIFTLDIASDLTRSSILGFYKDGIISSVIATGLLIQAGINAAAAALFILGADFDIERTERKQRLNITLDEFRFGGLTTTEASDRIAALGFETRERELALLDLEALRVRETRRPSKADLDKFLTAGLLTSVEYLSQLERLGYSPEWSSKYLALIEGAS